MAAWLLPSFVASVAVALACGFLAHYARDVRRDPRTTRVFALAGAAAALASIVLGAWLVDG